ncbi:MAG TPA: transcription elongation factor GreA [Baekduia sp.]|nr:transcription elongation factor GreA [Baekduia sp.]
MAEQTEAITAEGLAALKAELEQLEGEERRKLAARILAAREHGDLSENAEYHAAKEDQAHLETKILRLQDRLRSARVVAAPEDASVVSFGAKVAVVDEASGKPQEFLIVGPTEADLKQRKLSAESPVAKALMGAAVGETVDVPTPGGKRRLRVERVGS